MALLSSYVYNSHMLMRKKRWPAFVFLGLLATVCAACGDPTQPAPDAAPSTESASAGYDPSADTYVDLQQAVSQATRSGRRILLEVGGEWCIWCHYWEDFLAADAAVSQRLTRAFVVLKVNYSPENENSEFLSQYPQIPGYPHFFVLDTDGSFLHSQGTAVLELGSSYDPEKVLEFIRQWGPNPAA